MKRIIFIYFGAGLLWCLMLFFIPDFHKTLERCVDTLARQWTADPVNPDQFSFRNTMAGVLHITLVYLPALLPCAAIGWKLAKLENPAETPCNRMVMAFGTTVAGALVLVPVLVFIVTSRAFR